MIYYIQKQSIDFFSQRDLTLQEIKLHSFAVALIKHLLKLQNIFAWKNKELQQCDKPFHSFLDKNQIALIRNNL